jgi:hypothetical protein
MNNKRNKTLLCFCQKIFCYHQKFVIQVGHENKRQPVIILLSTENDCNILGFIMNTK